MALRHALFLLSVSLILGCNSKPTVLSQPPTQDPKAVFVGEISRVEPRDESNFPGNRVLGLAFLGDQVGFAIEISEVIHQANGTNRVIYRSVLPIEKTGGIIGPNRGLLTLSLPLAIDSQSRENIEVNLISDSIQSNPQRPNRLVLPMKTICDEITDFPEDGWVKYGQNSKSLSKSEDKAGFPNTCYIEQYYVPKTGQEDANKVRLLNIKVEAIFSKNPDSLYEQIKAFANNKSFGRIVTVQLYSSDEVPSGPIVFDKTNSVYILAFAWSPSAYTIGSGQSLRFGNGPISIVTTGATAHDTTLSMCSRYPNDHSILIAENFVVPTNSVPVFYPIPKRVFEELTGVATTKKHVGFLLSHNDNPELLERLTGIR
jgi:hypothetical protein